MLFSVCVGRPRTTQFKNGKHLISLAEAFKYYQLSPNKQESQVFIHTYFVAFWEHNEGDKCISNERDKCLKTIVFHI